MKKYVYSKTRHCKPIYRRGNLFSFYGLPRNYCVISRNDAENKQSFQWF
ncbi:MAG: hypothetical protein FWG85_01885 [Bacteroidetes bacterium]|nr:hypothetical protein [Bacteroidota bacterium]